MIAGLLFGLIMRWRFWSLIGAIVASALLAPFGYFVFKLFIVAPSTGMWWFIGSCVGTAISLVRRLSRYRRDRRARNADAWTSWHRPLRSGCEVSLND